MGVFDHEKKYKSGHSFLAHFPPTTIGTGRTQILHRKKYQTLFKKRKFVKILENLSKRLNGVSMHWLFVLITSLSIIPTERQAQHSTSPPTPLLTMIITTEVAMIPDQAISEESSG